MNRLVSSIRGRYAGNRSDILRFSFFSFRSSFFMCTWLLCVPGLSRDCKTIFHRISRVLKRIALKSDFTKYTRRHEQSFHVF